MINKNVWYIELPDLDIKGNKLVLGKFQTRQQAVDFNLRYDKKCKIISRNLSTQQLGILWDSCTTNQLDTME